MFAIVHFMLQVGAGFVLLLLATLVFDLLHVILHRMASSRRALWRAAGESHMTHHRFLDTELMIHEELIRANVLHHVVPEFLVQVLVTLALAAFFPTVSVATALLLELGVFIFIMWGKPGFDVNHHPVERLLPYRPLYFCVPEYHLLHHRYPTAYFSSWIKTIDHFLGTGTAFRPRCVLISGSESAFGSAMVTALQQRGAAVVTIDYELEKNKGALDFLPLLARADILFLCHDEALHGNYSQWLEVFYQQHADARYPVEVWALASTKPEALNAARESFRDGRVIYRYIDLLREQAHASLAGPALKNISRGFNFVHVIYRFSTLQHYWQLVWK